jgi:hypothetical protein
MPRVAGRTADAELQRRPRATARTASTHARLQRIVALNHGTPDHADHDPLGLDQQDAPPLPSAFGGTGATPPPLASAAAAARQGRTWGTWTSV